MDYPEGLLEGDKPISFHKYWLMDPYKVYTDWLDCSTPSIPSPRQGIRVEL